MNDVLGTVLARLVLDSVQLPVLLVMQLIEPPGLKLPATRALATAAPELTSRTAAVARANHFFNDF